MMHTKKAMDCANRYLTLCGGVWVYIPSQTNSFGQPDKSGEPSILTKRY